MRWQKNTNNREFRSQWMMWFSLQQQWWPLAAGVQRRPVGWGVGGKPSNRLLIKVLFFQSGGVCIFHGVLAVRLQLHTASVRRDGVHRVELQLLSGSLSELQVILYGETWLLKILSVMNTDILMGKPLILGERDRSFVFTTKPRKSLYTHTCNWKP